MSSLFGWLNGPSHPEEAARALAAMLGALPGDPAMEPERAVLHRSGAIAAHARINPVAALRSGALVVGLVGRPRWDDPELAAIGRDEGPGAALAEAYRRHGSRCIEKLQGSFSIAVADDASGEAFLAVDRMGVGTLCYAPAAGGLVFGSTAESVAAHPAVGRKLSAQGIFNYLYHHVVPSPGTIYEGIAKLAPGECLAFRNGTVERRFYWKLQYAERADDSFISLKGRFRSVLDAAANRAIDGETRIAAFLSGGTDSSTVVGLLSRLCGVPAHSYSIGFSAEGFDEMEYARITARHFHTEAHEYYVKPDDVLEAIPVIARWYDEPFGNDSAVPTYFCARLAAKDGVQVMLAGDGGDELFGGNARYAKQKVFEWYGALPSALRRDLIEPLTLRLPGVERIPPLRKVRSYVEQALVPLPDRLESYNFLHRSPLAEVFEPAFLDQVDALQPLALLRETYERTSSSAAVDRMMHVDLKFTLADNDLRKVSRMCEAAGVEVRYPLLDDAVVAFSGELPAALKVRRLRLRHFFKEALKDFLPPETIAKTKHGFGMPTGLWLKSHPPLRALAHDSLRAFEQRGILRASYIRDLVRQHESGHATYFGIMLWVILMLEQWLAARDL